jgi:N-acetylneuraminate synthase
MFGPDVPASVTVEELRILTDGIRFIERMAAHPVDKEASGQDAAALRALFTKSLVARVDLEAGTVLQASHLSAKKPGTGIPASRMGQLLGRRLKTRLRADELLREEDVEKTS